MKIRYVINSRNMPARLPLFQTLTTALALDHWHAPGWLWGALGVVFLVIWIASISDVLNTEELEDVSERWGRKNP